MFVAPTLSADDIQPTWPAPDSWAGYCSTETEFVARDLLSAAQYPMQILKVEFVKTLSRCRDCPEEQFDYLAGIPQFVNVEGDSALHRINETLQNRTLLTSDFISSILEEAERFSSSVVDSDVRDSADGTSSYSGEEDSGILDYLDSYQIEAEVLSLCYGLISIAVKYTNYSVERYFNEENELRHAHNERWIDGEILTFDISTGKLLEWEDLLKPGSVTVLRNLSDSLRAFHRISVSGTPGGAFVGPVHFAVTPASLLICRAVDEQYPVGEAREGYFAQYNVYSHVLPLSQVVQHLNPKRFPALHQVHFDTTHTISKPETGLPPLPFAFALYKLNLSAGSDQIPLPNDLKNVFESYAQQHKIKSMQIVTSDTLDSISLQFDRRGRLEQLAVGSWGERRWRASSQTRFLHYHYARNGRESCSLSTRIALTKDNHDSPATTFGEVYALALEPFADRSSDRFGTSTLINGTLWRESFSWSEPFAAVNTTAFMRREVGTLGRALRDSVFNGAGVLQYTLVYPDDPVGRTNTVLRLPAMQGVDTVRHASFDEYGRLEALTQRKWRNNAWSGHDWRFNFDDQDKLTSAVLRYYLHKTDSRIVSFEYDRNNRLIRINGRLALVYEYW